MPLEISELTPHEADWLRNRRKSLRVLAEKVGAPWPPNTLGEGMNTLQKIVDAGGVDDPLDRQALGVLLGDTLASMDCFAGSI